MPSEARIGPNAVAQTLQALARAEGRPAMEALRAAEDLPSETAEHLIDEASFVRLVEALRATRAPDAAADLLAEGGAGTARYVAANRIPAPVRGLLSLLPTRLALPILLKAFARHAWTFAGAGRFGVEGAYPGVLTLEDAPTCRGAASARAERSGAYYEAAFEGLLQLAAPGCRVREVTCQSRGDDRCRFVIELRPRAGRAPAVEAAPGRAV